MAGWFGKPPCKSLKTLWQWIVFEVLFLPVWASSECWDGKLYNCQVRCFLGLCSGNHGKKESTEAAREFFLVSACFCLLAKLHFYSLVLMLILAVQKSTPELGLPRALSALKFNYLKFSYNIVALFRTLESDDLK